MAFNNKKDILLLKLYYYNKEFTIYEIEKKLAGRLTGTLRNEIKKFIKLGIIEEYGISNKTVKTTTYKINKEEYLRYLKKLPIFFLLNDIFREIIFKENKWDFVIMPDIYEKEEHEKFKRMLEIK